MAVAILLLSFKIAPCYFAIGGKIVPNAILPPVPKQPVPQLQPKLKQRKNTILPLSAIDEIATSILNCRPIEI